MAPPVDPNLTYVIAGQDSLDDAITRLRSSDEIHVIRLGPGIHRVTRPVLLGSNTSLEGSGPGLSIIRASAQLDAVVSNANAEGGNRNIALRNVSIDCDGRAQRAVLMVRVSEIDLEDLEVTRCTTEGLRVSGRGEVTRGVRAINLNAHHNRGDGLIFMWATRNVQYSNVRAHFNTGQGIVFDHSEFQASNVSACDNGGDGIHLRNFFAGDLRGIYSCRNGRHGIFVEGMVASTGTSWISQSNGRSQPGQFDEIHFSASDVLSYGVSRDTTISGVTTGAYRNGFGDPTARHGVFIEDGVGLTVEGMTFSPVLGSSLCDGCTPQ